MKKILIFILIALASYVFGYLVQDSVFGAPKEFISTPATSTPREQFSFTVGTSTPQGQFGTSTLSVYGSTTIQTWKNTRYALDVLNAASSSVFRVDTINSSSTIAGILNVGSNLATSTFMFGLDTGRLNVGTSSESATSTFWNGLFLRSGTIKLPSDICAGLTNGGALVTDANGIITCEADDGGGGGTINSGTTNRLSYYSGATTLDSANFLTVDTGASLLTISGNLISTLATSTAATTTDFWVSRNTRMASSTIASTTVGTLRATSSVHVEQNLRVDGILNVTGNVGLNTVPKYRLHIENGGVAEAIVVNNGGLRMDGTSAFFIFAPNSTATYSGISNVINNFNNNLGLLLRKTSTGSGDYLAIQNSNSNDLLRFTSAGTFGIASTTPWGLSSIEIESGNSSTSTPLLVIGNKGSTSPIFFITDRNGGRIGIGTSTPLATTTISGHLQFGGKRPTVSSCGTNPGGVVGNDHAGKITTGTGVFSSCTLTFNVPWTNAPACMATNETQILLVRAVSTQITVVFDVATTIGASDIIAYQCFGYE